MSYIARQITIRATGIASMALFAGLTIGRADVIQPTVVLPPAAGQYSLGTLCVDALSRCTVNPTVSGFNMMTRAEVGGNEVVSLAALYTASVFTDDNDSPGTFVGVLSLLGTAQFTFVGRDPSVNPLGTFTTLLTDFDFKGVLNGNTFEVKQDPGKASTGSTTILETTFLSRQSCLP